MSDWKAAGPDPFGDFHLHSEGEELAKCVVIQNGFRTPEETFAIVSRVINAVNNHGALVKALTDLLDDKSTTYAVRASRARDVLSRTIRKRVAIETSSDRA